MTNKKTEKSLTVVPKGLESITDQFKESKNNIEIWQDGKKTASHEGITGHSINGPYLVVQADPDTQYIYHMGSISFVKIQSVKE